MSCTSRQPWRRSQPRGRPSTRAPVDVAHRRSQTEARVKMAPCPASSMIHNLLCRVGRHGIFLYTLQSAGGIGRASDNKYRDVPTSAWAAIHVKQRGSNALTLLGRTHGFALVLDFKWDFGMCSTRPMNRVPLRCTTPFHGYNCKLLSNTMINSPKGFKSRADLSPVLTEYHSLFCRLGRWGRRLTSHMCNARDLQGSPPFEVDESLRSILLPSCGDIPCCNARIFFFFFMSTSPHTMWYFIFRLYHVKSCRAY